MMKFRNAFVHKRLQQNLAKRAMSSTQERNIEFPYIEKVFIELNVLEIFENFDSTTLSIGFSYEILQNIWKIMQRKLFD